MTHGALRGPITPCFPLLVQGQRGYSRARLVANKCHFARTLIRYTQWSCPACCPSRIAASMSHSISYCTSALPMGPQLPYPIGPSNLFELRLLSQYLRVRTSVRGGPARTNRSSSINSQRNACIIRHRSGLTGGGYYSCSSRTHGHRGNGTCAEHESQFEGPGAKEGR